MSQFARGNFYAMTLDWTQNAIAISGASQDTSQKNDSGGNFVIRQLAMVAYLSAALGSAVIGTPLPFDSSVTQNNNTMATLAHLRVQLKVNDGLVFRNPIRANLLFGDGRQPFIPITPWLVKAGDTIFGTIYNDATTAGTTLFAQIALIGEKQ